MPRKSGKKKQKDAVKSVPAAIPEAEKEVPKEAAKEQPAVPAGTSLAAKLVLLGVFALLVVFLVRQSNTYLDVKGIQEKCLAVQNDPLLKYPCKCLPTKTPDENDTVYSKTTAMCTCECDIGNGTTWVTEIRMSK